MSLRESIGYLHSIETFGAVDGPGVRFVAFLQGCPLRCLYCHNPDSWKMQQGRRITAGELLDEILEYRSFLSGGVTLSGGEPLAQPEFCLAMLRLCKEEKLHTAIDTSGSLPLSKVSSCIEEADLLLLDIKDIDPEDCKKLTGQDNRHALAILRCRESLNQPVWIRHVCVPNHTLFPEKLRRMAETLRQYTCIERVELIPFHQMGSYKWEESKIPYSLKDLREPTEEEMSRAREILQEYGVPVV